MKTRGPINEPYTRRLALSTDCKSKKKRYIPALIPCDKKRYDTKQCNRRILYYHDGKMKNSISWLRLKASQFTIYQNNSHKGEEKHRVSRNITHKLNAKTSNTDCTIQNISQSSKAGRTACLSLPFSDKTKTGITYLRWILCSVALRTCRVAGGPPLPEGVKRRGSWYEHTSRVRRWRL